MSRTGPRLKFRKGSNAPCARCGSIFYSHPSRPINAKYKTTEAELLALTLERLA